MDIKSGVRLGGVFVAEVWRPYDQDSAKAIKARYGFDSFEYRSIPRYLLDVLRGKNIITNQGLTHYLNTELAGGTAITAWYCTLVETDTAPAAAMTYAVPVYTESTAYDEATRPAYVETVTDQTCTNSASKAAFTINATKTMYGASLVGGGTDANTKGDTAGGGTLSCYAKFSSSRAVLDNDTINLTYAVSAADDGI